MCIPNARNKKLQGTKNFSKGTRLDKARNSAQARMGGGTPGSQTILKGSPRNTDVEAIRKTTMLGV